jgi:hypothetical protein
MIFKLGRRRLLEWTSQTEWRCHLIGLIILLVGATGVNAQRAGGELRIEVHDPRGVHQSVLPPSWLVTGINFTETFTSIATVAMSRKTFHLVSID